MRRVEDLQLGYGLSHALSCEREMDECPTCIKLRSAHSSWPPSGMIETDESLMGFASNFHVLRANHEYEQAQETAVTKQRVREILRRA